MSEVKEQGATRRVRRLTSPDWYKDNPLPLREPAGDKPRRRPKGPGRPLAEPKHRRPFPKEPYRPGHGSPSIPKRNPDGGVPLPNAGRPGGFGKRIPDIDIPKRYGRLPRFPLPGGPIWDIIPIGDTFFPPKPFPTPVPNPANGWLEVGACPILFGLEDSSGTQTYMGGCLSLQSGAGELLPGVMFPPGKVHIFGNKNHFGLWMWNKQTDVVRYSHVRSWRRASTPADEVIPFLLTGSPAVPVVDPLGALNPNVMRALPSLPPPDLQPGVETVGVASGLTGSAAASLALVASINAGGMIATGLSVNNGVAVEVGPAGPKPGLPTDRKPPKKNEKQRKTWSKSRLLAVLTFKALDEVSEAAEVVDALYDALPGTTKDKWKCAGRGLTHQAGQYGIDAADCKAKALYHNFHKLDILRAVENLILNHLQDKVVGLMQRNMPANVGSAVEGGEIALNKFISDTFGPAIRDLVEATAAGGSRFGDAYSLLDANNKQIEAGLRRIIREVLEQT